MRIKPNNDQTNILRCPNKIILIKAVAGAGKTTILAMLAQQALERGLAPESMIGLCFSPGARLRFQEKLREETDRGSSIHVVTMEDFARKLIEDLSKEGHIELPFLYRDVDDIRGELVAAAARVWERYEARGVISDFNFQLDENNQHIADLARQMSEMKSSLLTQGFAGDSAEGDELSEYADEIDRSEPALEIIREYEIKRHPYADEFTWQGPYDAVSDLVFLLKCRPELVHKLYRWPLYLIDEWHDINAAEFELIRLLRRGARLVVVGDQNQTINTERGADPKFAGDHFLSVFREGDPISLALGMSYRFGKAAAGIANRIVNNDCAAHPDKETSIRRVRYSPLEYGECANSVAHSVLAALSANADGKTVRSDFAIVLRDVDQSVEIEAALIEANIPYKCDGFESFFLLPEILMLRGLLHYVSNHYETLSGSRETCEPMVLALSRYFYVTRDHQHWHFNSDGRKSFLRQAQDDITQNPNILKDFFDGVLLREHKFDNLMARRWKNIFKPVVNEMMGRSATSTAYELLSYLNDSVDLQDATSRAFVNRDRVDSASRSIRAFLRFVERHGKMPTKQFLEKLWKMQNNVALVRKSEIAGKLSRQQRLVRVTTIQAAKGREWKYVLMPYMEQSEFMRSNDLQLNLRILYVGITRTILELVLFEPNDESIHQRITHLAPRR